MCAIALVDHYLTLQCLLDLPLCFHLVSFYKFWLVQYTATGGQCYQHLCMFWSLCHACSLVAGPLNIYSHGMVAGG
ncbi:unnamed protein product [Lactuca virosa]|uniref:Uncharacterized protein n=1 Tax=Lactuca virosa TaxID=75947 RepID=A0AAU9LXF0_9ASTR|nr:unnamed protein product [Lactuca virosa]